MLNRISFTIIAFALLCLAALGACQTAPVSPSGANADMPVAATRVEEPYKLGSADRLRVTVYGEPELSGEFVVDGGGFISLPLIETVQVQGLTVQEFQKLIEQRFSDGFLRQPRVSAEVLNYRPYYILGEVGKPGEYPYTNGLTVMNAIATAEGFTYRANKSVVVLKSATSDQETRVELTPSLRLQPGDTIRVVERFF